MGVADDGVRSYLRKILMKRASASIPTAERELAQKGMRVPGVQVTPPALLPGLGAQWLVIKPHPLGSEVWHCHPEGPVCQQGIVRVLPFALELPTE